MAATASSDVSDGPVLNLINKRLRALRKKLNRITQMEESITQGKPINKEQEEVLRSKPSVLVLIDELEKLRQPLSVAVSEEIDLAVQQHQVSVSTQPITDDDGSQNQPNERKDESDIGVVEDIVNLLYFGSLFDVKSQSEFTSLMLTRTHERGCCLTYDYVTDDATDLLGERDLDLISKLGGSVTSRPGDSSWSHKNALKQCIEHAKLWLAKSDQPIDPNANVTYAGLRERLNKIMALDYFTTTPEMKGPVEVAAAAAGNYANFPVPVPVPVPIQVEDAAANFHQKDEAGEDFPVNENSGSQSSPVDELQKDEVEAENPTEVLIQQEEAEIQAEETDPTQYILRRNYPNQRGGRGGNGGGRRGGYSSGRGNRGGGRGGGPYQNGRSQYYDQPGNYYPRNYYNNRGRGGGRGGGYSYNNNHATFQGGRASASVAS